MKIYYTEDKSELDSTLEQTCPFNEMHTGKRKDGSEYSYPIYVGSNACVNCKHCYGEGFSGYYSLKGLMLIPVRFRTYYEKCDPNETSKGLKQYRYVSKRDYIKCEMTYNEIYRQKSKLLKFKIWWWHKVGVKIIRLRYKLDEKRVDSLCWLRMKFENLKYKIKNK